MEASDQSAMTAIPEHLLNAHYSCLFNQFQWVSLCLHITQVWCDLEGPTHSLVTSQAGPSSQAPSPMHVTLTPK